MKAQFSFLLPFGQGVVSYAALFFLALIVSGCAVIEKFKSNGMVERSVAVFAPISIDANSPEAANAVHISGIGLGILPGSAVLGAYRISAVQLDLECRIVVIPQHQAQLENFRNILGDTPDICGVGQ